MLGLGLAGRPGRAGTLRTARATRASPPASSYAAELRPRSDRPLGCGAALADCPRSRAAAPTVEGSTVHCMEHCRVHYTVHCTVHYTVHYIGRYILHCIVHCTAHCIVNYTVHCTVHCTVHYVVQLHCALPQCIAWCITTVHCMVHCTVPYMWCVAQCIAQSGCGTGAEPPCFLRHWRMAACMCPISL